MPKAICRTKKTQTTHYASIRGLLAPFTTLPSGVIVSEHSIPTLQVSVDAALAAGAETASLLLTAPPVGVTDLVLEAGTTIEFAGATPTGPLRLIQLAEDATITTASAAFPILPAYGAIPANTIAEIKPLKLIHGCRNFTVAPQFNMAETTDYGDGFNTTQDPMSVAMQANVELDLLLGDEMHRDIEKLLYFQEWMGREIFLEATFTDGKRHSGYAKVNSGTPAAALQTKQTVQLQLNFQGGCYDFRESFIAA
jgi:hypothetical protein